mgnify:FL=1
MLLPRADEGAAQAYSRAAEMHQKLGSENDMANSMKEAGSMFEKAGKTDGALAVPPVLACVAPLP